MKINDGYDIIEGRKTISDIDPEPTIAELIQLSMGAVLDDNGDIWCLQCNKPNECCTCGM